ncbi:MAG: hypothetical protein ACE5RL_06655 [Nitrosarchaeum sp.]
MIEYVNGYYPQIYQIVGGIHATIIYSQILENYPFLILILSEGELTFGQLADELPNENTNLEEIKGIAFFKGNSIVKTDDRALIEDLDILKFPKHELFLIIKEDIHALLLHVDVPTNAVFAVYVLLATVKLDIDLKKCY